MAITSHSGSHRRSGGCGHRGWSWRPSPGLLIYYHNRADHKGGGESTDYPPAIGMQRIGSVFWAPKPSSGTVVRSRLTRIGGLLTICIAVAFLRFTRYLTGSRNGECQLLARSNVVGHVHAQALFFAAASEGRASIFELHALGQHHHYVLHGREDLRLEGEAAGIGKVIRDLELRFPWPDREHEGIVVLLASGNRSRIDRHSSRTCGE